MSTQTGNELHPALRYAMQAHNDAGLHSSAPAVSAPTAGDSYTLESNTHCSSPTASVQGPFSRKRLPSPEVTTGSLSTLAPSGKKACFSLYSDFRQPQSILTGIHQHSINRHTPYPEHTALTSAVTVEDDDDLDEAVSSFRAPPGLVRHPEDPAPDLSLPLSTPVNPSIQSYYRSQRGIGHSSAGILSFSPIPKQPEGVAMYSPSLVSRLQSVPAYHTFATSMAATGSGSGQVSCVVKQTFRHPALVKSDCDFCLNPACTAFHNLL